MLALVHIQGAFFDCSAQKMTKCQITCKSLVNPLVVFGRNSKKKHPVYMYLVTHYPVNSLNDIMQKLSLRNFPTNVIQAMFCHRHRQGHDWPATPHSFCLSLFLSQTPLIQSTWDDAHCTWVKSDRCCHGVSSSLRGKPGSKFDPFLDLCR